MPSRQIHKNKMVGIDTSAYTTSVAVMEDGVVLVADVRQGIPVAAGGRGLRSADAHFHHVRQFSDLWQRVLERVRPEELAGVAVSAKPRPLPQSYLPPFTAGTAFARVLAQTLDLPCIETTHQEGHLRAGLWSAGGPSASVFHALHLSGGTTELLEVRLRPGAGWAIRELGASEDLYVGQLIDRVGVRLGLPFPAGPGLEVLAQSAHAPVQPLAMGKPRRRDGDDRVTVSFSGPEADAFRRMERGENPAQLARAVEETIAATLSAWVMTAMLPGPLLVVGGVAANQYIRERLRAVLAKGNWELYFAAPEYSRDNAVGVALLGWESLTRPTAGVGGGEGVPETG